MALELRQVEVRPAAAREQPLGACGRSTGRSRTGCPRPARRRRARAARAGASRAAARGASRPRRSGGSCFSPVSSEIVRSTRVDQVRLALDHVRPGRRVRVLEVGHEDLRARVERVDHHLPLGRAGDLDAPVLEVGRRLGDLPVALADLAASPAGSPAARRRRAAAAAPSRRRAAPRGVPPSSRCRVGDELERVGVRECAPARRLAAELDARREVARHRRRLTAMGLSRAFT